MISQCLLSLCADGHHYRAAITKVLNQSSAEVYYVDYGNSDVCSVENLKVIDRKFLVLEVQAIYCRLANATPTQGVTWPEPVISRFQELALERQLVGKVLKQGGYSTCYTLTKWPIFLSMPFTWAF